MSNVDFSKLNIPLHELEAYVTAEREAQERAARDEAQAQRDALLFEREARIQADREAAAAARAAGDPNIKAARLLADMLGDQWATFIPALNRVSPPKFVNELLKLNSERIGLAHHQATAAAPQSRADAQANAEAVRKAIVEGELGRLGIYDVTPDEDAA